VSPELVGIIGIVILIILLLFRMTIGLAMALVGFLGFAYISGFKPALGILATQPYSVVANYTISVVPLFLLMGSIAANTGIGTDLYKTAYKWLGQLKGGLAMATIGACSLFAAICGSSIATSVTIGKVALPEMKKYGYDSALATGSVAAGGTLGILIPPSLGFILYAILTEQSVGLLFIAGILPGILLTLLFITQIGIQVTWKASLGPTGPKTSFLEKIVSLKSTYAMVALFLFVMGGIYFGFFTPTEAGALGVFGAVVISIIRRKLTFKNSGQSLLQTSISTAMVLLMLVGAMIFMRFLAVSKLPFMLATFVTELAVPPIVILSLIVLIYIILGMFLDIISSMILTVPIIFPAIIAMGFDPIWFGVIVVLCMELGMITPPVGLNVFALAAVTDVPLTTVFRGTLPFALTLMIGIILVIIFPQIALFLPRLM